MIKKIQLMITNNDYKLQHILFYTITAQKNWKIEYFYHAKLKNQKPSMDFCWC